MRAGQNDSACAADALSGVSQVTRLSWPLAHDHLTYARAYDGDHRRRMKSHVRVTAGASSPRRGMTNDTCA